MEKFNTNEKLYRTQERRRVKERGRRRHCCTPRRAMFISGQLASQRHGELRLQKLDLFWVFKPFTLYLFPHISQATLPSSTTTATTTSSSCTTSSSKALATLNISLVTISSSSSPPLVWCDSYSSSSSDSSSSVSSSTDAASDSSVSTNSSTYFFLGLNLCISKILLILTSRER